jgi:hypothetical protein
MTERLDDIDVFLQLGAASDYVEAAYAVSLTIKAEKGDAMMRVLHDARRHVGKALDEMRSRSADHDLDGMRARYAERRKGGAA